MQNDMPIHETALTDKLIMSMQEVHIPRLGELPRIELYLDQVVSLISQELSFLSATDEKIITGSMVNNYVKQQLVPAPLHKRYTTSHVGWLIFVCIFKKVLSIEQVKCLKQELLQQDLDTSSAYDICAETMERAVAARFGAPDSDYSNHMPRVELYCRDGSRVNPELERLLEAAVALIASKIYVDHMLLTSL